MVNLYFIKLAVPAGCGNTQFVVDPAFYRPASAELIILGKPFNLSVMLRFVFFFLVYLLLLPRAGGQTSRVDSLREVLSGLQPGKEYVQTVAHLADQVINPDTLLPYVIRAEKIAAASGEQGMVKTSAIARVGYYIRKNDHDSALLLLGPLLKYFQKDKTQQHQYLSLLFLKSKVYDRGGQYTLALATMIEVIDLAENLRDTLTMIQARTGIGWVQIEMGQYKEALQWLNQAMYTSANHQYYKNYGALYSNLAMAHNKLGHADSALYYIEVAIRDARLNNNLVFLANALSMQARIFIDNKKAPLAEAPLNEAVLMRKKMNDPFYVVYDMSSLAAYYAANHQPEKGIALSKEGIAFAQEKGLSSQLLMIYQALADNYKAAGIDKAYSETLEKILRLKDSFSNINSSKLLADLQANHEARKKEKLINEQEMNLTKKNYWLAGTLLFTAMAAAMAWLLFRNYRRRKKLELEKALEEEKRMATEAVRLAEEKERVRIASDLHDNLGAYAASMASSLNYIRVQENDERSMNAFDDLRNNSGSIISQLNDTIWVLRKESLSLTAISDRVKLFISRISRSYPEVRMEVSEQIEKDHQLSAAHAFHLYRVIQEAVNNALRHSGGKSIIVYVTGSAHWNLRIEDDGKGFTQPSSVAGGGHGLQTMKERCREAGWSVHWSPGAGGGTMVEIRPTTN